jgi:hypothetical protein
MISSKPHFYVHPIAHLAVQDVPMNRPDLNLLRLYF